MGPGPVRFAGVLTFIALVLSVLPVGVQPAWGASVLTAKQNGEGRVSLSWTHQGQSPATQRVVVLLSDKSNRKVRTVNLPADATSTVVSGLTSGKRYLFQLETTMPKAKATATVKIASRPSTVKNLRAVWVGADLLVTWSATGSGTLVGLVVSGENGYKRDFAVSGSSSGVRVTGADPAGVYRITAIASNPAGLSQPARATSKAAVPGPPELNVAAGLSGQAVLTWSGSSADTWRITVDGEGDDAARDGDILSVDGSLDRLVVDRLTPGRLYRFTVAGINSLGRGQPSSVTSVEILRPLAAPSAVIIVAGDGSATLSWSDGNGAAPVSYQVRWRLGNLGEWSEVRRVTVRTTTINGLINGNLYQFQVEALDTAGTSSAAQTVSTVPVAPVGPGPSPTPSPTPGTGTPGTPPSTPSAPNSVTLQATASAGSIDVNWNGTIQQLHWQVKGTSVWNVIAAPSSPYTLGALSNGTTYVFRPMADGTTPLGSAVEATPTGNPTSVRDLVATAGFSEVRLSWLAPSNDGGSPVSAFVISWSGADQAGEQIVEAGQLEYTVTGLRSGNTYDFTVRARTALGSSSPTAATATSQ
jgi:titin